MFQQAINYLDKREDGVMVTIADIPNFGANYKLLNLKDFIELTDNRYPLIYDAFKMYTEAGLDAKKLVRHGDITNLSIFANHLKQKGGDVIHGAIREVSLVLAGANPGAFIDSVIAHSEDAETEGFIYTDEEIVINHSDSEETKQEQESDAKNEITHTDKSKEEDTMPETKEKTVQEVYRDWETDRKSTRLNSSHSAKSRMPSSA